MFDWSNRMIGSDDPEYQTAGEVAQMASMELYAYASELFGTEAGRPPRRPDERPHPGRDRGRAALVVRARALLPAADRGRQRDDPEPDLGGDGHLLRAPGPVGAAPQRPVAAAERGGGDAPLRDPGDELPAPDDRRVRARRPEDRGRLQGGVLPHLGQPRRAGVRRTPRRSTSPGTRIRTWRSAPAGPTSAWAPTWPAWRSGSCSSTCSTGCPTWSWPARSSVSSRPSSAGSSTSRSRFPAGPRVSAG